VQLTPAERAAGVVAFSSGNHAQGVALAAQMLGIHATIVMPADAPPAKLAATRGYGAEVVLYDRGGEVDREAIARRLVHERGAMLVPPYDDARIIAGQGTTALELLEAVPDLDLLLMPVGGGGLMAGCAIAAKAMRPAIEIYGVEPAAGDDFKRSLARGQRVSIAVPQTIADGQRTTSPGELTFAVAQRLVRDILVVEDDELRDAMRFAFERLKLVLEPSGAAALAALLAEKVALGQRRAGVILSGGNADPALYAEIIAKRAAASAAAG
jgi:threonine dehydratase